MLPNSCNLCGSNNLCVKADFVYGDRTESKAFYQCHDCDVVFQYPFFSKEEEEIFYKKNFERYMSSRSGNSAWLGAREHIIANEGTFKRRFKFLRDWINIWNDKKVLEIGCSSGFMLFPIAELGATVNGIEPSDVFSEFLVEKGVNLYSNLEEVPDESMDIIMHFFVMEHITDIKRWLLEQYRILKPGGSIIIEVPSCDDPLYTVFKNAAFHRFYWSVVHPWYFNKKSVEFLIDNLGFLDVEILPYQRYGLKNHFNWAINNSPGMDESLIHITETADAAYKEALELSGNTDTLLIKINKS